ncbi:MAG: Dihydroorotate dehydrogenase B (NAD(+)), catalytic subunit [bacterium]|nr:MAG: Dihydroorotate dehydrogenase B (NAD(+)), catalytic subunit [Candidatus Hinthialibacteria bacterium OLB16]MBV6483231.1 Dihydroorotate dehydrogenase B (NAD(+)), catalytic subunit [bacterium]
MGEGLKMASLETRIGMLHLKNPVMPASGTFGYGEEFAPLFDLNELGAIVSKAVSLHPRPGNLPPRLVELKSSLLNSIGLQNPGAEGFLREKIPFLEGFEPPLIVNVVGNGIEEYQEVVEKLDECPRVDGFEINLSCPNVKRGLEFGTTHSGVERITTALRQSTRKPLWVKLSPNVPDPADLGKAAEGAGADAIVAINTLGGMAVDIEKKRPILGAQFGGVSGPAVKPVALKIVWNLYKHLTIPVIGVGGIMNGRDAIEFLMAGATAVQVGTANFINPCAMIDILREIRSWMDSHEVGRLEELIGAAHP